MLLLSSSISIFASFKHISNFACWRFTQHFELYFIQADFQVVLAGGSRRFVEFCFILATFRILLGLRLTRAPQIHVFGVIEATFEMLLPPHIIPNCASPPKQNSQFYLTFKHNLNNILANCAKHISRRSPFDTQLVERSLLLWHASQALINASDFYMQFKRRIAFS